MFLAVWVLAAVFALIVLRRSVGVRLRIWQIMLGGALAVLAGGVISPSAALKSINPDVMVFLFGMFVVGEALEESGYLAWLSYRVFGSARSPSGLVLMFVASVGFASALLMNDTLAIIGTPVALYLSKRHGLPPKMMLLCLAFAVTVGGVASPIGNPQNLLIAVGGLPGNPFIEFARYLLAPTAVNLAVIYLILRIYWPAAFLSRRLSDEAPQLKDSRLAGLSRAALAVIALLVALKVTLVFAGFGDGFRLTYIAVAAAAPILILSRRRLLVLGGVDWRTLVFFASMFVLMESVWDSGFLQSGINGWADGMASVPMILAVSVVLSQLISNVPLVALYQPMLLHAGAQVRELMALAAGSTIAGNLTILGAASNVIIVQNSERRGETLTFWDFTRVGLPLTAVNVLVYWLFPPLW